MNKSVILHVIGWILTVEAAFMLLPCIVAVIYKEQSGFSFLITIGLCLLIGIPLLLHKPKEKKFFSKEGFVSVALSWIVMSIMGALPFYFSKEIPHYVDALFEVISGFTTTGSSILNDVEALSYCMIFWRSFTHWLGGMGILVFILTILPITGGESMHLLRAESPGPTPEKLVPRIKSTSKILYTIYLGMTILQIILLVLGQMPFFDAVTISMGTAGTGGFAIKNSSIASYSIYNQNIITVFMILFGVNFNIYYLILIGKFKNAFKSEELRYYLFIIFSAIMMIAINLGGITHFTHFIQVSAFQVASIITTTGYATIDFNTWPTFSKTILVFIMFVGACAGSTGGGIKVSRIIIMLKSLKKELSYLIHKRSIKVIRFDNNKVAHETLRSINVYFISYMIIFAASIIGISIDDFDFATNVTAVAATLNNIGPGLEIVGPAGNFGGFTDFSKIILIFDMLAGRLEIFPMLVLLAPGTWRK
ncbi:trk system potassium uptake protein TrkH [Lachnotalea glycerini]|uniref:Trk system potassium uptake protein TrkH n=1 Tax=Lachnotalea glycerini TaxID=1763509 RepID=A0A318EWV5_9FIRM|nr:TrkH family potassium uptake protein [Lachnotalea glycerini]PXV91144.1 trk system potassium uptake protein TrkH [Lachnotalea glycerini]